MVCGCANSEIRGNERSALLKVGVGDIDGRKSSNDICHNRGQDCCPPKEEESPKELTNLGSKELGCKWWTLGLSANPSKVGDMLETLFLTRKTTRSNEITMRAKTRGKTDVTRPINPNFIQESMV